MVQIQKQHLCHGFETTPAFADRMDCQLFYERESVRLTGRTGYTIYTNLKEVLITTKTSMNTDNISLLSLSVFCASAVYDPSLVHASDP